MSAASSDESTKSRPRWDPISTAVGIVMIGVLVWVIAENGGVATVQGVITRLRYTWPILVLPTALSALVVVFNYRACLPNRGRDVPFMTLVQIERSGNALNAFLPLGDSSGNIIKVALLRHWYTSDQIVAAAVWSSMGTGVGNAFASIGPLVAGFAGALPWTVAGPLAALSIVMAIPATLILVLVRHGLAARVAWLLGRIPFRFIRKRRDGILAWAKNLDHHVASAVRERRRDFANLIFWKATYQTIYIGHLYLIIELLGLSGGIYAALAYNAMNRGVQQLLPFIPGRMGVAEAFSATLFRSMGWPAADGVSMALVLRFTFFVNLLFSGSALSGSAALARRYPPRTASQIEAARSAPRSSP